MENWGFLDYFLAAAREENFTKAAQSLFYTQPYLSKKIAALEDELGVALFKRNGKRVTLTLAGEDLYHRVLRINAEIHLLKKDMERFRIDNEQDKTSLKISSSTYTICLGNEFYRRFYRTHSSHKVILNVETDTEISSDTDIRIYYALPKDHAPGKVWYHSREAVFLNPANPLRHCSKLSFADLNGCTAVLLSFSSRHMMWKDYIEKNHPDIDIQLYDDFNLALHQLDTCTSAFWILDTLSYEMNPTSLIGIPLKEGSILELHIDILNPNHKVLPSFWKIIHELLFPF